MHGTGQTTKSMPDYREPQLLRSGRKYFVISPGSIPLKSIVSRDVVFTLQEKLFGLDSVKRLYLVTGIIIQSGTTEHSAFVIRKDSKGVF